MNWNSPLLPKKEIPFGIKYLWALINCLWQRKHNDLIHVQNAVGTPNVSGKHNKNAQKMSLKINVHSTIRNDGIAEAIHADIYKEVLPGLESWKASKIASWHSLEGDSIQWFCVVCMHWLKRWAFISFHVSHVSKVEKCEFHILKLLTTSSARV